MVARSQAQVNKSLAGFLQSKRTHPGSGCPPVESLLDPSHQIDRDRVLQLQVAGGLGATQAMFAGHSAARLKMSDTQCNLAMLEEMPSQSSDWMARQPQARGWLG